MERIILRHLKGSKASQVDEFPLADTTELVLGRDPSSTVRFDPERDDLVGRQHARIARDPADPHRFSIVDLNSRNGTYLNKLRVVGSMPLQPGDIVQLGAGGPEIQFDLEPLPAQYVKATRLAVGGGASTPIGLAETRTGPTASAGGGGIGGSAPRSGAAAGVGGTASASAKVTNSIGKATVERLIGQTKSETRRNMLVASAAALLLVAGTATWLRGRTSDEVGRASRTAAEQQKRIAAELDSAKKAQVQFASNIGHTPAQIAEKNSGATVQVAFSWNLIHAPTGTQVYHLYIPNRYRDRQGREWPLIANQGPMIPAYISVGNNVIEPRLTVESNSGAPIAVNSYGSGFVVTNDGFILTNRHVAANWRTAYRFDHEVGILVDAAGHPMFTQGGQPALVRPPNRWVPSETKQAGPKGDTDVFLGRQEYLYVMFPKNTLRMEAQLARVSDRHDVALIKVNTPQSLPKVELFDNYEQIKLGEQVVVLGYPGVSDAVTQVIKSKDMFNREWQQRTVPDPTLSVGFIGKVLRAVDGAANDVYFAYAPSGDTYQLTINSTGGGNSGGPMFDNYGRVVGIYFASKTGDARITFAVPIRYGLELMSVAPNAP